MWLHMQFASGLLCYFLFVEVLEVVSERCGS